MVLIGDISIPPRSFFQHPFLIKHTAAMAPLSKLVIAIAGTLPHDQYRIKKWVETNGGCFSHHVQQGVTHLLASKDAYKKNVSAVRTASELGIWIVSFDWFDDSLQARRKLGEKKYTWESLRKTREKSKKLKHLGPEADGKKFREGCKKARELTGSGTSKRRGAGKRPRASKSFFFGAPAVASTPFVSATKDLERRRAARAATLVASDEAVEDQVRNPIEIGDDSSNQAGSASNSSVSPTAPSSSRSSDSSSSSTATSASPGPVSSTQAKIPHFKDLYHYYLDSTGFEYKIILARSEPNINSFARYHIGLLETHTKPHTYCTIVQYTPPAPPPPPPPATEGGKSSESEPPVPTLRGLRKALLAFNASAPEPPPLPNIIPSDQPTRLTSLVTLTPSPTLSHKSFICPPLSPYTTAFRAFRHAFRDITLLAWEERFDANKTLQAVRAKFHGIEPYLYKRPGLGMPMGLLPQVEGGLEVDDGGEGEGYVRGKLGLVDVERKLEMGEGEGMGMGTGVFGRMLWREEEDRKKVVEEQEEKVRIKREGGGYARAGVGKVEKAARRREYNKPFFNCATGVPHVSGGRQDVGYAKRARAQRAWPRERDV